MQSLNGTWKIATDPKNVGRDEKWFTAVRSDAQDAPVPGILQQVFPEYHGVVWYWKTFTPSSVAGAKERCLLSFGSVDYLADVWVNGKHVGGHEIGETPFTLDVTDAILAGKENLIAVRVLNPKDEPIDGIVLNETPHRNKFCTATYAPGASFNHGGITGNVEYSILPALRVTDVFPRANPHTGEIRLTITVQNDMGESVEGQLAASAGPAAGSGEVDAAAEGRATFAPGSSEHEMLLTVAEPHLWNLDDPFLYRVCVRLQSPQNVPHEKMVRCGFRELRIENGYFRLNGKRIFLKSTHTGNHFPISCATPPTPELLRRDFLMAKVAGYNCVRFIAGMALPEQLDFCDEIGLMVYEECNAGWFLQNSPHMKECFDRNVREMILRDRNHPSLTIWGLLNETGKGEVFWHASKTLRLVRSLDDTRLVTLNSGRFDTPLPPADDETVCGSVSNPGSDQWEYLLGAEDERTADPSISLNQDNPWYYNRMGDVHFYPPLPHPPEAVNLIRNLGKDTKPVILSEYGVGSMMNVLRELRWYEQNGARLDMYDSGRMLSMSEKLQADWKKWGFDGTYMFTEDFLWDSQRRHVRLRLNGFDMIRSNPKLCGYNVTGMLDHGMTGEGVWTFWREWKPGAAEGLSDGWAPLRWCLFVDPVHAYTGQKITVEAVLANEDVLAPGTYPVCLRIRGPEGVVWEKRTSVTVPEVEPGQDGPMAIPVFRQQIRLMVPTGEYELGAYMEKGGAPSGGKKPFYITSQLDLPKINFAVETLAVEERAQMWLASHGVNCKAFGKANAKNRGVILVGSSYELSADGDLWKQLAQRMATGSCVIFLSPKAFIKPSLSSKYCRFEREKFYGISKRNFEVANRPKDEWLIYSHEYYGPIRYLLSRLPNDTYTIELGFCEGCYTEQDRRVFDVNVNGINVLKNFDIVKEAGGPHLAVVKTFTAKPKKGCMDIEFAMGKIDGPSLSRIRVFNSKGVIIAEDAAVDYRPDEAVWIPLKNKGKCPTYKDDLYHKETVAKRHPIFDGVMNGGIMDWNYYGPINPHTLFQDIENTDDVAAASFASGYIMNGGYVSGVTVASYPFAAGRFILNSLQILENLGEHPAADRIILNMIHYAAGFAQGPVKALPKNFNTLLKNIGL